MDKVKQECIEDQFPSDVLMSYWADPKVEVKMEDKSQVWPIIKSEGSEIDREKKEPVEKEQIKIKTSKEKKQNAINIADSDVSTKNIKRRKIL